MALTTRATNDDPLFVASTTSGTVSVSFDGGETWTQFRTLAHYLACMEHLDRLDVGGEQARIEAYQARVRDLRDERIG